MKSNSLGLVSTGQMDQRSPKHTTHYGSSATKHRMTKHKKNFLLFLLNSKDYYGETLRRFILSIYPWLCYSYGDGINITNIFTFQSMAAGLVKEGLIAVDKEGRKEYRYKITDAGRNILSRTDYKISKEDKPIPKRLYYTEQFKIGDNNAIPLSK